MVYPTAVSYDFLCHFWLHGRHFFAQWFCPCGQSYHHHHQKVLQKITWLLLSRLQGNKPHSNSPEPSEPCLRYLHQHTPEPSRTFREPSGTLQAFRNLHTEPTPAHTGTLRNLREPSSGTCSCDPHRHTELIWAEDPISYYILLRCWGTKKLRTSQKCFPTSASLALLSGWWSAAPLVSSPVHAASLSLSPGEGRATSSHLWRPKCVSPRQPFCLFQLTDLLFIFFFWRYHRKQLVYIGNFELIISLAVACRSNNFDSHYFIQIQVGLPDL